MSIEQPKHTGERMEVLPPGVSVTIDNPEQMKSDEETFTWMNELSNGDDNQKRTSRLPEYKFPKYEDDPNNAQA